MPFSAAEKRRRREAERNAALRGNPDALEKRAREAARKKRQREAAEAERARKMRRKGELRVANSISSAIAAAATNKALSDAAALARYDRLLLYERVTLEYLCRRETYPSIDASAASGLARAARTSMLPAGPLVGNCLSSQVRCARPVGDRPSVARF